MNANLRILKNTFNFSEGTQIQQKFSMFFGHYDLRVYVSDGGYLDVGRGSFDAACRLGFLQNDFAGCIGTVGRFCDFSMNCTLFGGLEHHNDLPVNIVMSNVVAFCMEARFQNIGNLKPRELRPFHIGNAVVLSADAKVLNGAHIGDGTLLAASAVASGNIEPFSVYGGVQAKKIKDRVPESTKASLAKVRWWDFDITYLANNLHRLQELAVDEKAEHIYSKDYPKFVLKMLKNKDENLDIDVLGFLHGSEIAPISEAPKPVRDYVSMVEGAGPYQWVLDVWNM